MRGPLDGSADSLSEATGGSIINLRKLRQACKLVRVLSRRAWWRGLPYGVAATVEHRSLPVRDRYAAVIDVGANKGQFALFARSCYPHAELYCFEPLEQPLATCRKVLGRDPKAHLYPVGLGASDGPREIHIARRPDSSSLLPISALQTSRFPGTDEVDTQVVDVRALDHVFGPGQLEGPVLLKIDVQGSELEVLRGSETLLRDEDCTVLVECSFVEFYHGQPLFDEVYQFLRRLGYALQGGTISATGASGRWEQGDFVFERADRLAAR